MGGKEHDMRLVDVRRIWSAAPHNAFTDLLRWQGRWYCVFREGQGHVSPDGALRVLESADGTEWASVARMTDPADDLRDAKLTVTPDGRLMLSGAAVQRQTEPHRLRSLAWFSADGRSWSDAIQIGDDNFWLWRMTWHKGVAYSMAYGTRPDKSVRLYASTDGISFSVIADRVQTASFPNEASLLFLDDDSALCLLRRETDTATALLGRARPPYSTWAWQDLSKRVGGPHFIRLPDDRIVAGVRLYDGSQRTALCWLDIENGALTEALTLPSSGDSSYCGMVWHDNLLWVSYYSSHEEKTAIYLARVAMEG
jgi:hypothetical protein